MARNATGFSLIEIAIVLVVVGLLLSGGLLAIAPVIGSQKVDATRRNIAVVHDAIIAFAVANNCVPCPAAAAGTSGLQQSAATPCDAAGCTAQVGVVPWATLGLSQELASDAFGRRLTFAVVNQLHEAGSSGACVMAIRGLFRCPGAVNEYPNVTDANEIVVERADGTVVFGGAGAPTDIAYVIVSHGPDGSFGAAVETGTVQADRHGQGGTDVGQPENGDGDLVFADQGGFSADNVNYYDDIVSFRTARALISECRSGACGNPN